MEKNTFIQDKKIHYTLAGICLFHSHAAADDEVGRKNRDRSIRIVEQGKKDFIHNFFPSLFAEEHAGKFESEIAKIREFARGFTADGIIAALRGMRDRKSYYTLLPEFEKPLQFVIGKKDQKIPYDKIMAQSTHCRHSHIIFLRETGHMGLIEEQELTIHALSSFAKKCFG
ncbi:MAG: hypothetical protein K9G58_14375 [Bacteroidales bacterium]|nr:hypothetical protein [Bacteroidales bacterium]MCF8386930.1 hypothetical protein [Bacteroidales bacterium]MCF8399357.1 hypothetical protein [Bacteroidales bacterium]